jgi:hypothetical protein
MSLAALWQETKHDLSDPFSLPQGNELVSMFVSENFKPFPRSTRRTTKTTGENLLNGFLSFWFVSYSLSFLREGTGNERYKPTQ